MFVQGGLCFFCKQPLLQEDASVEHLVASVNGGSNENENCVACCKSVNALFGSMSLKEKLQVVLNQKGNFKCPNGIRQKQPTLIPKPTNKTAADLRSKIADFEMVVENLTHRGESRPRTLKALTSTVASIFPKRLTDDEAAVLIQQLQLRGKILVSKTKITYTL